MIAILYRSDALVPVGSAAEAAMLTVARERNKAQHVSGFLYRENNVFYQWLEGPAQAVKDIYASIQSDPRHIDVRTLSEHTITDRHFGFWSMGYADSGSISLFDWAARNDIPLYKACPTQLLAFLLHCARRT